MGMMGDGGFLGPAETVKGESHCNMCNKLRARITELEGEKDELREALKPFARFECGCGECHNCIAHKALEVKDE